MNDDNDLSPSDGDDCLEIGGDKGHQVETISGQLLTLYRSFRWKMIPRCTGRYTCRDHALVVSTLPPLEVLSNAGIMYEEQTSPSADEESVLLLLREYILDGISGKDRIIVVPLDDRKTVGLITYVKGEASGSNVGDFKKIGGSSNNITTSRYVHTLNAKTGFRRKLEAMGAFVADDNISYGGNPHVISCYVLALAT